MRELFNRYNGDRTQIIEAYADAEQRGEVQRKRNGCKYGSIEYATRLFADGVCKRWLSKPAKKAQPKTPFEASTFIINLTRFDSEAYIEGRVSVTPQNIQGSLRTTLSYLYLTDGPINLPKDRFDLAFDHLEPAERIVARWLYIRTNGNLRATYGRKALLAARTSRYRCDQCGFSDVRTLNLDHIQGRVADSSFACLCANCHTIKSRQHDWTGAPKRI